MEKYRYVTLQDGIGKKMLGQCWCKAWNDGSSISKEWKVRTMCKKNGKNAIFRRTRRKKLHQSPSSGSTSESLLAFLLWRKGRCVCVCVCVISSINKLKKQVQLIIHVLVLTDEAQSWWRERERETEQKRGWAGEGRGGRGGREGRKEEEEGAGLSSLPLASRYDPQPKKNNSAQEILDAQGENGKKRK